MGDSGMESGLAQTLVQQRLAVAVFSNRLTGEAPYSTGAQDVRAAVRWLCANAGASGLGTSKVAAWGQSAGGWMATMLGVTGDQATIFDDGVMGNTEQSDAVQAAVPWYGPADFAAMDAQSADVSACAGQAQSHGNADSTESQIPAFLLAHGHADCNVPTGQSQQLREPLGQVGAEVTPSCRRLTHRAVPHWAHETPTFRSSL